ncbi:MAG TPA: hypothetical protein VGB53_11600 [Rubricoccaceae bacterium]|jgi:hypothetical protein
MRLRLSTLAAAFCLAHAASAQTPADSLAADSASVPVVVEQAAVAATEVADEVEGFRVRPIFSVGALYSGSRGIGVGGGVAMSSLIHRGDHLQIEGRLAQHVVGAFGSYQTGEPERATLFTLVGASVLSSSRFPYAGTGPRADPEGQLFLDRFEAEAEARVGWQPAGLRGPLVQPFVQLRTDELRGRSERRDGSEALVSEQDLAELDALTGQQRTIVSLGLGVQHDTRDNEARPTRGTYLQASASRAFAVDGSGLRFNSAEFTGYLFRPAPFRLPLQPERGAVFVRAVAAITREDVGADGLPLFYLPVLDRDLLTGWPARYFVGRDAVALGVGARGVVIRNLAAFRVEGTVLAMVGAAYDDVFTEFTPRVSTSRDPVAEGAAVPLRPSVGFGLNLHYRDRERPLVGALLGVGPDGTTVTSFRLIIGLDRYQPSVR